jgi:cytochrome o ubiquinol oxidase subunit II
MNKKNQILILFLIFGVMLAGAAIFVLNHPPALLNPKGIIAAKERSLMITATLLMLIVVVPVYFLTFFIVWRFHESNHAARYEPNWDGDRRLETTWWAVPTFIIAVLALVTWHSSHSLDPFKSLASAKPPLKIQVVALQWKWLFIYPQQNIASVNFVQFPKNTPLEFSITSDAPMNSFWIPQLGGQIYAMSDMSTKLNLEASQNGNFVGSSANISGSGFSTMRFTARASSDRDFKNWISSVKNTDNHLSLAVYDGLSRPSQNNPVTYFASTEPDLYQKVVLKFMSPNGQPRGNYDLARDILGVAPGGAN